MVENITKLEKVIGAVLPFEYKDFLINIDDQNRQKNKSFNVKIENEVFEFGLTEFETFPNLLYECKTLFELSKSNIEENGMYMTDEDCFLRIAMEESSRLVLIGVRKPFYGMIYLLDNDFDYKNGELKKYFVANTFSELYKSLY